MDSWSVPFDVAMSTSHRGVSLLGRRSECDALDRLLAGVRSARSQALVIRGEPGAGKSALLEYLADRASGCQIVRAAGVESEMELAFAGAQQLCSPLLGHLQRLPAPQQEALGTAFGLSAGQTPDPFLVGLAVLSLVSEASEERPLVCLVDDAQWLDRASIQTLVFVARRLLVESVALVFVVREPSDERELSSLPDLVLRGLEDADARALLDSVVRGRLDEQIRDRIVAETRGNPLALVELPRGLTPEELAGGFALPRGGPVASHVERSFRRQVQSLPRETRQFLLVAAAEPVGDVPLLWRAAERLGLPPDAAAPAEAEGLIEIAARVRFRHPLVRSAAYQAAPRRDAQRSHAALADATDQELDPDRRAWHRAHAATGPDEGVAGELERSASRAQSRGGISAAAAFLQRATELTPDPASRGRRALAAAQAKFETAAYDIAEELLATAEICPLVELERARLERLRARIVFARTRGGEAPLLLLKAARRMEQLDSALARETYLEALGAAIFAGRLSSGQGVTGAAKAARAAPPSEQPPRKIDLLLDGLAIRFSDGSVAGARPLEKALQAFTRDEVLSEDDTRWLWLACRIAPDVWGYEAMDALSATQVRLAREAGALASLPIALTYRAGAHVLAGEFDAASALIEEANDIMAMTGNAPYRYGSLVVEGWRGRTAETLDVIAAGLDEAARRGEGRAVTLAAYATAVLNNGLGNHQTALEAAQRACEHDDLDLCGWALIELVEAGSRTGQHDIAADAMRRLDERTRASATDWGLGVAARSRALLSDAGEAEAHYREAIVRLTRTRIATDRARSHLVYGEWLRRSGRRLDARGQLRAGYDMFSSMGAEAFAERARRELLATGETVRKRVEETRDVLTAQETQIARLAADGRTNPEIASHLFLSRRTVEWHLHNVFGKLGISSRRELRPTLRDEGPAPLRI